MERAVSRSLLIAFLFVAMPGAGHSQFESPQALSGKLTITGSSTVAPLVSEIGKRFEQLHQGVRIDVQTGGSSRGITDATRGTADIGMSSRALKDSETTGVRAHTIAQDGVAILVHASNPVSNLDEAQILGILQRRDQELA